MDRRKFLTAGPVGAGLALTTLSGAAAGEEKRPLKNEPQSAPDDFALNEMTIAAMQKKMESGELTSLAITGMYLKRIDAIDKNGIRINAVIELNPDARAIAKTMDAERKENKVRGPLHGIPVLIKDNIDTADAMMTTAGALALSGHQGAETVVVDLLKACKESGDAEYTVLCYEFKDGVNAYLARTNTPVRTLAGVIEFNRRHANETMPYFKQETLEVSESKSGLDAKEYRDAVEKTTLARQTIDALMKEHRLDAVAGTSIGPPGCIDLVNGDCDTGFYFCTPAAMAGYPHITVPMGKVHELPVGLSLIASAYQEPELLAVAYAFEQASKKREPPKFLQTLTPA